MLKVQNRAELDALSGKTAPTAPAPPPVLAPVITLPPAPAAAPLVEQALVELAGHVQQVATLAASAIAQRPKSMEAIVHRDSKGRMDKITVTIN